MSKLYFMFSCILFYVPKCLLGIHRLTYFCYERWLTVVSLRKEQELQMLEYETSTHKKKANLNFKKFRFANAQFTILQNDERDFCSSFSLF